MGASKLNTIWTRAVASMGQKDNCFPLPDFSAPPDGFYPDHGCSLAMGQLPLKITMPVSLTSHIMQLVCTVVDLFYYEIYLLAGLQRAGKNHVPLCLPKALGALGCTITGDQLNALTLKIMNFTYINTSIKKFLKTKRIIQ